MDAITRYVRHQPRIYSSIKKKPHKTATISEQNGLSNTTTLNKQSILLQHLIGIYDINTLIIDPSFTQVLLSGENIGQLQI